MTWCFYVHCVRKFLVFDDNHSHKTVKLSSLVIQFKRKSIVDHSVGMGLSFLNIIHLNVEFLDYGAGLPMSLRNFVFLYNMFFL